MKNRYKNSMRAFTQNDAVKFLKYVRDSQKYREWYPIIVILVQTGCRVGEILALHTKDVNLEKKNFEIRHSMIIDSKNPLMGYRIGPTKSIHDMRVVKMDDDVYRAFYEILNNNDTCKNAACTGANEDSLIFMKEDGKLLLPHKVNYMIHKIQKSYNLEESKHALVEGREPELIPKFRVYEFRHLFQHFGRLNLS